MEPAVCRGRLARILAEETAALDELASYLAREHEHLAANDVEALTEAIRQRQQCVARVVRSDDGRRALCRELGRPADAQGLREIMRWCDPEGALAADWKRYCELAARCRALNDGNSALVGARLKYVQARLGTLLRERGEAVTYGRKGAYSVSRLGRVVKIEA